MVEVRAPGSREPLIGLAVAAQVGEGPHLDAGRAAPVGVTTVAVAVALAVAGGLIAGAFGGWRASRLRPADALSRVA